MSIEQNIEHANKLKELRKDMGKSPLKKARYVAGKVALMKYFNPYMDWLYGIALSAALLKDIVDLVGIGSLPAIGTVITLMASITIFAVMFITGNFFKKRWAKKIGVVFMGTAVEIIFGLNFLPVETAIVIIVFYLALDDRRKEAEAAEKKKAQAASQHAHYSPRPEFAS